MRGLFFLGLVGCTFELRGSPGDAISEDATLGDDATDAFGDGPPGDQDNDGVPDLVDNCPMVANASQRDHDGDTHGDPCDRCPHLASATDPDIDADGVGNACDPRPSQAGDARVLWDGFYDANDIAAWAQQGSGTWSVTNGALTGSAIGTFGLFGPSAIVSRAHVATNVRVDLVGASITVMGQPLYPTLGVYAGASGMSRFYVCGATNESGANKVTAWSFFPPSTQEQVRADWTGLLVPAQRLEIVATLTTTNGCTVRQGSASGAATASAGPVDGSAGLFVAAVAASFDYVFVVSVGP